MIDIGGRKGYTDSAYVFRQTSRNRKRGELTMSEYRKAKPEEREACIEFADYVFSKAHCPHDFETLIPRVYGEGVDSASMHRIAVDERGKNPRPDCGFAGRA